MRVALNSKRLIYLIAIGIFLCGCSRPWQPYGTEIEFKDGPKILKYGAVDRLKSGQTWRVFVAAEDPNGDMEEIIFEMYQPGQGWYPEHSKRLKGEATRSFSGYFYLNTPSPFWRDELWGLELTLTVRIRDKVGYATPQISLPVLFIGNAVEQPTPEGFTEDEVRPLGAILIDLYREDEREYGPFGR